MEFSQKKGLAFIYIRVSTKIQSDFMKGHVSMDAQEDACVKWAQANGYVYQIYREAVSARKMTKQTYLNKIKKQLRENDILVVYSVSRFSRNMIDAMDMLRHISNVSAKFFSVSEGFDYSTHQGKQMIHMSLASSQFESDEISARVRRSLAIRRARGDFIGKPSFGWRCERLSDGKRIRVINRDEAYLAVRIMDMADGVDLAFGMGVLQIHNSATLNDRIATQLNQEGLTYCGKSWTAERVKYVQRDAVELRNLLVGASRNQIQPLRTRMAVASQVPKLSRKRRLINIFDVTQHQGKSGYHGMQLRNTQ